VRQSRSPRLLSIKSLRVLYYGKLLYFFVATLGLLGSGLYKNLLLGNKSNVGLEYNRF
jgi:hypothetical protein